MTYQSVVVVTRDLMDGGRFRLACPEAVVVRTLAAAKAADADLIVLDLASGIDASDTVAIGPDVLAYGAHVDEAALAAAIAVGCVDAVARSAVFRRAASGFV